MARRRIKIINEMEAPPPMKKIEGWHHPRPSRPTGLDIRTLEGPVSDENGVVWYPDGSWEITYEDGTRVRYLPNEGGTITYYPDGSMLVRMIDSWYKEVYITPDGIQYQTYYSDSQSPEGEPYPVRAIEYPNNSGHIEFYNDGSVVYYHPNGTATVYRPDGTVEVVDVNPEDDPYRYYGGDDGPPLPNDIWWHLQQNPPMANPESGAIVYDLGSGNTYTTYPDGTTIATYPGGYSIIVNPDGSYEINSPPWYQ